MTFEPTQDPEIGRRTSRELTAARNALGALNRAREELEWVRRHQEVRDPVHFAIAQDLERAVVFLEKYKRTGRPRKAQEWTPET